MGTEEKKKTRGVLGIRDQEENNEIFSVPLKGHGRADQSALEADSEPDRKGGDETIGAVCTR